MWVKLAWYTEMNKRNGTSDGFAETYRNSALLLNRSPDRHQTKPDRYQTDIRWKPDPDPDRHQTEPDGPDWTDGSH